MAAGLERHIKSNKISQIQEQGLDVTEILFTGMVNLYSYLILIM